MAISHPRQRIFRLGVSVPWYWQLAMLPEWAATRTLMALMPQHVWHGLPISLDYWCRHATPWAWRWAVHWWIFLLVLGAIIGSAAFQIWGVA